MYSVNPARPPPMSFDIGWAWTTLQGGGCKGQSLNLARLKAGPGQGGALAMSWGEQVQVRLPQVQRPGVQVQAHPLTVGRRPVPTRPASPTAPAGETPPALGPVRHLGGGPTRDAARKQKSLITVLRRGEVHFAAESQPLPTRPGPPDTHPDGLAQGGPPQRGRGVPVTWGACPQRGTVWKRSGVVG